MEEFDFSGFDNLDLSSLLGGDSGSSGVDLSGMDFGPEAFDISSLLGGGDKGIDFPGLACEILGVWFIHPTSAPTNYLKPDRYQWDNKPY
jgi:hypothetical protein